MLKDIFKCKIENPEDISHVRDDPLGFLDGDKNVDARHHTAILTHPNSGQDLLFWYLELITGIYVGSQTPDLSLQLQGRLGQGHVCDDKAVFITEASLCDEGKMLENFTASRLIVFVRNPLDLIT